MDRKHFSIGLQFPISPWWCSLVSVFPTKPTINPPAFSLVQNHLHTSTYLGALWYPTCLQGLSFTGFVTKVKPDVNPVGVHPNLHHKRRLSIDGELVAVGSLWPSIWICEAIAVRLVHCVIGQCTKIMSRFSRVTGTPRLSHRNAAVVSNPHRIFSSGMRRLL